MELLIRDGDYVPDGRGGLQSAQGEEELLQRALFRLTMRRGSFPFLPELGSELYRLTREKPSAWQGLARQYAAEALRGEEGVTVTDVVVTPQGEGARLDVLLDCRGNAERVTVEL